MKIFVPSRFYLSLVLFCILQLLFGSICSFANATHPILIHSAPVVVDGWIYFRRAHDDGPGESINNGLYKIRTDGTGLTFLNCYTESTPCVSEDGTICFRGVDGQLMKTDINGSAKTFLTAWTASTPSVFSSGDIYFENAALQLAQFEQPFDSTSWPVLLYSSCCSAPCCFEEGAQQKVFFQDKNNDLNCYDCINKNITTVLHDIQSTPCVVSDSSGCYHIFFQTTKNELKRAEIGGKNIISLNEHTASTPCIGNDWWQAISYVFFQTPNNELKKVNIEGKEAALLHHKIMSTPCVKNDWDFLGSIAIYFQGDDERLLKCDENGNNLTDFESTDLISNNTPSTSSIPWNWN